MVKEFKLLRSKSKPGMMVQRFGDWKKGQPQVLIENHKWQAYGKPDAVIVLLENSNGGCNCKCHGNIGAPPCGHCYKESE